VSTALLLLFLQIFPHIPGVAHRFLPSSIIFVVAGLVLQVAMFILAVGLDFISGDSGGGHCYFGQFTGQ
jgi:hypothetical protein